ncbi:hypothetical protein AGMMS4956_02800 [Bacteroidia bacterium]|nr:hypothetical protein AGMMS4956_02800 [Bacteroidia bacterium]
MTKQLNLEHTYSISDLPTIAALVLQQAQAASCTVIAFDGTMGVGKTTLIKEICKQLQVVDTVTSPTFAIINEYATARQNSVYHFDFYRLNNVEDALQLGIEEYFERPNLCLIEWPQLIAHLLPSPTLWVHLCALPDNFLRSVRVVTS